MEEVRVVLVEGVVLVDEVWLVLVEEVGVVLVVEVGVVLVEEVRLVEVGVMVEVGVVGVWLVEVWLVGVWLVEEVELLVVEGVGFASDVLTFCTACEDFDFSCLM